MIAFGDIVEEVSDAALGIGADDGPQRPPVRQKPVLFLGIKRLIGGEQGGLPGPEIGLLRQKPRRPEPVENLENRSVSAQATPD